MCKKQCWSVWLICSVALLLVDLRSVALLQKDTSPSPRRCYSCGQLNNSSDCNQHQSSSGLCPTDRPYCGTVATTPDLSSSLICVEATERACSLTFAVQKQNYQIICVCATDLCNSVFSSELRDQLLNFTAKDPAQTHNSTDLSDLFFNSTKYNNVTKTMLYQAVTNGDIKSTTPQVTTIKIPIKFSKEETHLTPRAEALKQEATAPSDDDEDESEGSGSFEETRAQKRPASAPAAPNSFLPASENNSTPLLLNTILIVPLFLLYLSV